jgi:hypothetical protein
LSADIQKIRESRFFRYLPERVFDRVISAIKVRAYEAGDTVLEFSSTNEFEDSYGYIISGTILFLNTEGLPIGVALKDELFLTRPFTLNSQKIQTLIAVDPRTFVVFVPRNIISMLAEASAALADLLEEIYESVFERSMKIRADVNGCQQVQSWIKFKFFDRVMSEWLVAIEERRKLALKNREDERRVRQRFQLRDAFSVVFSLAVAKFIFISSPGVQFVRIFGSHTPDVLRGAYWFFFLMAGLVCLGAVVHLYLNSRTLVLMGEKLELERLEDQLSKIHEKKPIDRTALFRKIHNYMVYGYFAGSLLYLLFVRF